MYAESRYIQRGMPFQHSGFDQVDKAHMDVAEIDRASIRLQ